MTDEQLRRLARAILGTCLLLAIVVAGGSAATRLFQGKNNSVVAQQLPLPEPGRLPVGTITVTAPLDQRAAPASGVTGTTALPALPVPAALADRIVAGESGIVAARPFSTGRATSADRGRALQCLAAAVYYEAASEPDAGQQAVAQVVLNRARHPAFPGTVCGVVYQGSERVGCQFSFACDGSMARAPTAAGWARATRVAAMALAGRVFAPVGLATHYHTYAVTPSWNRSLVMTDAVGAHFFHRWKGYWGTAAAFSRPYRGGEPVPGPHMPATVPQPALASATMPVPALSSAEPARPESTPLPPRPDSNTSAAAAKADVREDDDQILPQWRNSGKPINP